jgi:tetratricopeptide (TPR) repeat protein
MYQLNPRREQIWEFLQSAYSELGSSLAQIGQFKEAETAHRRAIISAEKLYEQHPESVEYATTVGIAKCNLVFALTAQGRGEEAQAEREAAVRLAKDMEAAHPEDVLVLKLNVKAAPLSVMSNFTDASAEESMALYRRWVELFRRLAKVEPDNTDHASRAIELELSLVSLHSQRQEFAECERILQESQKALDALPEKQSIPTRILEAAYHEAVGNLAYQRDKPTEADAAFRKAIDVYAGITTDFPNSHNYRSMLANCWTSVANVWRFCDSKKDLPKAREAYMIALGHIQELMKLAPDNVNYPSTYATVKGFLKEMDDEAKTKEP